MSFVDAVRSVFSKYATLTGRARRSEFWWFAIFGLIVDIVVAIIDSVTKSPIVGIGAIVLIVFECQDSQPGDNNHGPSPRQAGPLQGYAADPYGTPA